MLKTIHKWHMELCFVLTVRILQLFHSTWQGDNRILKDMLRDTTIQDGNIVLESERLMHNQGEKQKITNQQLIRAQNKLVKAQNLQGAMKMMIYFREERYSVCIRQNISMIPQQYIDFRVKW